MTPDIELPVGVCPECARTFRKARKDQRFCRYSCNRRYYRRREQRAATAYELLVEWRETRGGRKGVLGELAAVVDKWITEDRSASRPSSIKRRT